MKLSFDQAVRLIREKDRRFDVDAFSFLRDSLDFTVKKLRGEIAGTHVNGRELLLGFRDYALKEFGPMAGTVLRSWGLNRCQDVGDMVFHLIELGVFGRSESDKPEDFADIYDFDDAFRMPFRPRRLIHGLSQGATYRSVQPSPLESMEQGGAPTL